MSKRRRTRLVPMTALKRGPNGRLLCRFCRREVPKGRDTFCSDACVHEYKIRSDPSYMRAVVFKRDNGICKRCGLDCIAEYHRLKLLERTDRKAYEREVIARKIPQSRRSLWDVHHLVHVAKGGGECGLDNLITLCVFCHRKHHGRKSK